MMSGEPGWETYATFRAVMREGSLSAAARTLGLSQPTVRRHVEELQERLGAVLFTRAPNGLVPTDLAHRMLPFVEAMAGTSQSLVRAVSGDAEGERGTVRVSASEVMGAQVLPRILAGVVAAHDGLQVEVSVSDENADLLHREVDVAVRMVRPSQVGLVAKRVGGRPIGVFASAVYLEDHGRPASRESLAAHRWVGFDRRDLLAPALQAAGVHVPRERFVFRSDDSLAQLNAMRSAVGIGVYQVPLAEEAGLQRLVPEIEFDLETWVVTHEELRSLRRVSVVFDALVEGLACASPTDRAFENPKDLTGSPDRPRVR